MKFSYPILLALCLLPLLTVAQKRTVLVDEEVELGMFSQKEFTLHFKKGESIILDVDAVKSGYLSWIKILDTNRKHLDSYRLASRIKQRSILVEKTGNYYFVFQNATILGRSYKVTVEREEPYYFKDTIMADTVVTFDTLRTLRNDTTPEAIMNTTLKADAALNAPSLRRQCVELKLPNEADYYFAYWLGIGEKQQKLYEQMGVNPPLEMRRARVQDPLTAYGMGVLQEIKLPPSEDKARYFFTDAEGARNYLAGKDAKKYNERGEPGYVSKNADSFEIRDFPNIFPLSFCVLNDNEASPVMIFLKIMGFKITTNVQEKVLEHVTIQQTTKKIRVN